MIQAKKNVAPLTVVKTEVLVSGHLCCRAMRCFVTAWCYCWAPSSTRLTVTSSSTVSGSSLVDSQPSKWYLNQIYSLAV